MVSRIALLIALTATGASAHFGSPKHNMTHLKAGFKTGVINYHHGKDPDRSK